jgi:hypothetical protein
MSRIKEFYHEELEKQLNEVYIPYPYTYKYSVYFNYNGEKYSLFADSLERIEELAKTVEPSIVCIGHGPVENEYVFECTDFELPIQIFENKNALY